MSEEPEPSVLEGLPHARPHGRSDKGAPRPGEPGGPDPGTGSTEPAGARSPAAQAPCGGATELLRIGVQAAAELAEIGLTLGARALRIAASRLPRP